MSDHDHDHDHPHEPIAGDEGPAAARARALEELLVEKGVVQREDVRRNVDWLVSRSPADGARLVARAWVDPAFKERLLEDARAAALDLGLDAGPSPVVVAVENTEQVHHMVVCTLCSCYPRALLGPPPAWYKSLPYRSRAVSDPRGVLRGVRRSSCATGWSSACSTRPLTSGTSSFRGGPRGRKTWAKTSSPLWSRATR